MASKVKWAREGAGEYILRLPSGAEGWVGKRLVSKNHEPWCGMVIIPDQPTQHVKFWTLKSAKLAIERKLSA